MMWIFSYCVQHVYVLNYVRSMAELKEPVVKLSIDGLFVLLYILEVQQGYHTIKFMYL